MKSEMKEIQKYIKLNLHRTEKKRKVDEEIDEKMEW